MRIDRVGPQLAAARGFGHGLADLLAHPDLIGAAPGPSPRRSACRCPGRSRLRRRRLVDVLRDDRQAPAPTACRPARPPCAAFIAARTSGGRSVDVFTISWSTLSKKAGSIRQYINRSCRQSVDRNGRPHGACIEPCSMDPSAPNAIRSASTRSRPTRTTASRRCARSENFPISGLRAPGRARHRHHPHQEGRGRSQRRRWAGSRRRSADAIIARGRRGPRRPAPRSVRRRRLSGGRRHVAQHERQRGARQPRRRAARRAARGTYARVHPNDHVNMGQSTNDVFPTATRLALLLGHGPLVDEAHAARRPRSSAKAASSPDVLKVGPHAPAGRGADHARTGVRRLCGLHRAAARTTSPHAAIGSCAS